MANVKKGQLTPAPEWWCHLRSAKRAFWKAERKAAQAAAQHQVDDTPALPAEIGYVNSDPAERKPD